MIFGTAGFTQAQWSNDVRLTNDNAASSLGNKGCLVASGDSLHVVWLDKRDGNYEIYYKRSTDGGVNWSSDTRLTGNDSSSSIPVNAISGSNLHVVWTDNRDGNNEIYYKHSTDGGSTWGSDYRLTNESANSSYADISVSGSVIHVVWDDTRDGNYYIYYKRSTDGGNSWGNDIKLSSVPANPACIAVSGSNVHVVWSDLRDGNWEIYYKKSIDGGINWGLEIRLTNNTAFSNSPLTVVSASVVHVIWYDSRDGNYEIYYKRSTDGGLTWGADTRLTNATGDSKTITLAVSGSIVHVAWQDNRNGNEEIFYKYSKNNGLIWSNDTLLVDNSSTMSTYPSIALSGSTVHTIWSDKRDGPNGEIYYKRNPTGNTVGVKDLAIAKRKFTVFPNPAKEQVIIKFDMQKVGNGEIKLIDITGRTILSELFTAKQGENNYTLQLNGVSKGLYYIEFTTEGHERIVKKLMVE